MNKVDTIFAENLAREERNAYAREWRAKNKEKVKKINANYWARRALKKQAEGDKI